MQNLSDKRDSLNVDELLFLFVESIVRDCEVENIKYSYDKILQKIPDIGEYFKPFLLHIGFGIAKHDPNSLKFFSKIGGTLFDSDLQDKPNENALLFVANNGFNNTMRLLLRHKLDPNFIEEIEEEDGTFLSCSPLILAATELHLDSVEILLENGAKLDCEDQGLKILNNLINKWQDVKKSDDEEVKQKINQVFKFILDQDFDISKHDLASKLCDAVQFGNDNFVRLLLERGADFNYKDDSEEFENSAIEIALSNRRQDLAEMMLSYEESKSTQSPESPNSALNPQFAKEVVGDLKEPDLGR
jgi:ankyrin repeat protein